MFEIIAFWIFVTLIIALIFAGPYWLFAITVGSYYNNLYKRINRDHSESWRDANVNRINNTSLYILKPWNWIIQKLGGQGYSRTSKAYVLPAIASFIFVVITVLGTCMYYDCSQARVFAEELTRQGSLPQFIIWQISAFSAGLASVFSIPIVIATSILLFDRIFVNLGRKALVVKSKLDKLENV